MMIILVLQHLNPRSIAEIYAFVRIQFLLRQHWLLSLLSVVLHKMLHIDLTSNLTSSLEVNEEIINKSKDKNVVIPCKYLKCIYSFPLALKNIQKAGFYCRKVSKRNLVFSSIRTISFVQCLCICFYYAAIIEGESKLEKSEYKRQVL